jgi:hypothetical protein
MYLLLVIYIYASYYFPTPRAAEDEGGRTQRERRLRLRTLNILCTNKLDTA